MSKIHVLAGNNNLYTVIVHTPVPAGNNAAGFAWPEAVRNSGRNVTAMTVGTGAGQITATEAGDVQSGVVIEGQFQWQDDPAWTNPQRAADLDLRANQLINELNTKFATELRMFGMTR